MESQGLRADQAVWVLHPVRRLYVSEETARRAGGGMMAHTCHATGCTVHVPPVMFMCKPHWFRVPKPMRDRIWKTYRAGQCDDMSPSIAYCEAAKAAVIAVAEKEGKAPDTALYDLFLARAR